MDRKRYLVTYDVREPRRLRRVFKAMKDYGDWLQYSVFVCDLSRAEKSAMQLHLGSLINHAADSIAIIDLGDVDRVCFDFMGTRLPLPTAGPTVV
jgi:CRISPR-associated protein Cas2